MFIETSVLRLNAAVSGPVRQQEYTKQKEEKTGTSIKIYLTYSKAGIFPLTPLKIPLLNRASLPLLEYLS